MTDYSSEEFWKGAPEGATHYLPVVSDYGYDACWYKQDADGDWRGCNAGNYARSGHEPWSLDCDEVEVFTRYLIKRPDAEWSSTGLPPVGAVCNMRISDGRDKAVEILGHGRTRAFIREVHNGEEWSPRLENVSFSVIRTPAQIAAEEREAAIEAIEQVTGLRSRDGRRAVALSIYEAGYRLTKGGVD